MFKLRTWYEFLNGVDINIYIFEYVRGWWLWSSWSRELDVKELDKRQVGVIIKVESAL